MYKHIVLSFSQICGEWEEEKGGIVSVSCVSITIRELENPMGSLKLG